MERDELIDQAVEWTLGQSSITPASLQRHLKITPLRARRLVRAMEEESILTAEEDGTFIVTGD
ncbi:HTH domain-containing protein [Serratia phage Parlo]|uniref:HTH domain-containing protein n=1 Tax=Serratia phage Parlo TaxID=2557554 RepID=A0A482MHZ6_9CAUD|nr:HTH domain-containing protein [Serratia phage Parlo]QBQ72167.1 HTH domain-containing protein [Serratia phage Parlo]